MDRPFRLMTDVLMRDLRDADDIDNRCGMVVEFQFLKLNMKVVDKGWLQLYRLDGQK